MDLIWPAMLVNCWAKLLMPLTAFVSEALKVWYELCRTGLADLKDGRCSCLRWAHQPPRFRGRGRPMASPSQRRRLRISAATVAVLTVTLAAIGLSRSLTDRASTEGSPVSIVLANPGP